MTEEEFLQLLRDDAHLTDIVLTKANLSGTEAYDLSLKNCTFTDVNFARADWEGLRAEDCTFHHCQFVGMGLDTAVFVSCTFFDADQSISCNFHRTKLRQATFTNCNLAMCDFEEAELFQITIKECHALGAIFGKARFKGAARITHNNLQYANLRGVNLAKCDLSHNNLMWASLDEANLEEANLMDCDLNAITYRYTKFFGADLRGAELISINPREADLRGAKIFDSQVRQLIENCDIVIFPDNR